MGSYFQIGFSESHKRDIRLEIKGDLSRSSLSLCKKLPSGGETYISLTLEEARRLHNALGQVLDTQQNCVKQWDKG